MMKKNLLFIFLFFIYLGVLSAEEGAILKAQISTSAQNPAQEVDGKIQTGSTRVLHLVVTNNGQQPNAPGTVQIRFMFCNPLEGHPKSLLFETENLCLPSINPGQSLSFTFTKTHTWPSVFDFIRYDWGMREYFALATINHQEFVIGIMPIGITSHYYDGIQRETPKEVFSNP